MESKAKVFGHPVHPMLVAFPLGLLATSFFFDLIRLGGGGEGFGYGDPGAFHGSAVVLSLVAVLVALVSGWLGGELVDRLGVGVDEGAHLDAPSSLSGRAASEKGSASKPLTPKRA
jgi:uncharacterized membrane protein